MEFLDKPKQLLVGAVKGLGHLATGPHLLASHGDHVPTEVQEPSQQVLVDQEV